MFNVAIKSLLAHKLRMALTAFAIVLGVSFVSGTYVFTDSINSTFSGLFADVYSGIDVTVRGTPSELESEFTTAGAGGSNNEVAFDESILAEIRQVDGVMVAAPEVNGSAQFLDKNNDPIGGQGPPTLGFSWTDEVSLNATSIKDGNGRAPAVAGEVVMDANTAALNDFEVGDTVRVQTTGQAEEFTLVGIISFGEADTLAGATLAAFQFEEAQRLFDLEGQVTAINIQTQEGTSPEELQATLVSTLPDTFEIVTGSQQVQETQDEINQGLGFIATALLAFAGVAIFVGTFIIQNTFRITISQRSKELALLRAVGATRSQILRMVLIEAFIIAIIASIIGIAAGVSISYLIRAIANGAGLGLPEGSLTLLPRTVIVSMLVGVIVTMLSALLPAIKASRVTPMEALRDNEANKKSRSLRKRAVISLIAMAAGGGVLAFGLFGEIASPIIPVGMGVFMLFVAVSFFAPILSRPLSDIIGWPFKRARGVSGLLAKENTKRTPRRTASTASALMIGVALVTFVSIFASSVKVTIDEVITESLGADVIIYSADFISGTPRVVAEELAGLDELDVVSPYFFGPAELENDPAQREAVVAVDPETFNSVVYLDPSEGAYEKLGLSQIIVRSSYLDEKGWSVGDAIPVRLNTDFSRDLEIVGTFANDFDSKLVVALDLYNEAVPERKVDAGIYANYAGGVSVEDGRAAVDRFMESYPTIAVQNQSELVEDAKSQIDSLQALLWGLLGLAIVIAVLGITNTLALSIVERTREIGLLRAVGMTKRQVRTMIRIEAVIISLFGAVLGVVMGIFFAWAVLKALESEGLTGFLVPPVQIAIYFVLAAIAGMFAAIWPAYRASKVDVLDAINFE